MHKKKYEPITLVLETPEEAIAAWNALNVSQASFVEKCTKTQQNHGIDPRVTGFMFDDGDTYVPWQAIDKALKKQSIEPKIPWRLHKDPELKIQDNVVKKLEDRFEIGCQHLTFDEVRTLQLALKNDSKNTRDICFIRGHRVGMYCGLEEFTFITKHLPEDVEYVLKWEDLRKLHGLLEDSD